jgi:hypothetical protein
MNERFHEFPISEYLAENKQLTEFLSWLSGGGAKAELTP